jgi:hypothetical protein
MRKPLKYLLWVGLSAVLLFVAYTAFVLSWAYSEGERAGVVQKFSRRGFLFKTWEGELAMTTVPGVAPVIWRFSVRDDAVAAEVSALLGRPVVLQYSEHVGVPSRIFGETRYFVAGVRDQQAAFPAKPR